MKVLALVTDAFGGHGGIALYTRNLLTALCQHPSRPEVIAIPRLVPKPLEAMPPNLDFRTEAKDSILRFILASLAPVVSERSFDLVICGHLHLLPVARLCASMTGAKLMQMSYGIDAFNLRGEIKRRLVATVDASVAIRQPVSDWLQSWSKVPAERCYVLENAIFLERYGLAERRADLVAKYGLEGKKVLLTLGRVEHEQLGFDEVVGVLPELVKQIPNLVYLIAGDGAYLPTLRRKIEDMGMADHVAYAGMVPEEDKADHYRLGDAFAAPGSHPIGWDDYPLRFVYLEAMACGLPVVATRPRSLINPADSPIPNIYVDPLNRDELRAGLLEALQRGPGPVPQELGKYDYPVFCERLHRMLDRIVGGPT